MRRPVEAELIHRFMRAHGARARAEGRVYMTGGASAVLLGWRPSTIDMDLEIVPDHDAILRLLPELKEEFSLNVELACPAHFIPPLPGWEGRSPFIAREGSLSFHHYDFYAQALSKIERGHAQDRGDVAMMLRQGLIEPQQLRDLHQAIVPQLHRYPAVDAGAFQRALDEALALTESGGSG